MRLFFKRYSEKDGWSLAIPGAAWSLLGAEERTLRGREEKHSLSNTRDLSLELYFTVEFNQIPAELSGSIEVWGDVMPAEVESWGSEECGVRLRNSIWPMQLRLNNTPCLICQ
jgi:hypothetical protein